MTETGEQASILRIVRLCMFLPILSIDNEAYERVAGRPNGIYFLGTPLKLPKALVHAWHNMTAGGPKQKGVCELNEASHSWMVG